MYSVRRCAGVVTMRERVKMKESFTRRFVVK
jgi:hypothetical protein